MGAQSRRGSTWVPIGLVGLAIAVGAAWLAGQQGDGRAVLNEPGDAQTVSVRALTVLPDLQAPTDASCGWPCGMATASASVCPTAAGKRWQAQANPAAQATAGQPAKRS